MRRGWAALTASVLTAPMIGVLGAGLVIVQHYSDIQSRPIEIVSGKLLAALFFFAGLPAILIVGIPSLWVTASLMPHRPFVRTLLLIAEGAVIGGMYLGIIEHDEVVMGILLGGAAALIASFFFSVFIKELARG